MNGSRRAIEEAFRGIHRRPPLPLHNIFGFHILSPILGILAYDATNRSELDIFVDKRPISIDFTNIFKTPLDEIQQLCVIECLRGV
ncbi:hypothetical protein MRB53_002461 [Persea americana]|uniref:Uncharacterized protein n=1 Tax=Persea americana TaxID=3435 RepID=A0ACC2MVH3_PERAE|nr:hypothetical protein MRB53_002461 [Persea americana]